MASEGVKKKDDKIVNIAGEWLFSKIQEKAKIRSISEPRAVNITDEFQCLVLHPHIKVDLFMRIYNYVCKRVSETMPSGQRPIIVRQRDVKKELDKYIFKY